MNNSTVQPFSGSKSADRLAAWEDSLGREMPE